MLAAMIDGERRSAGAGGDGQGQDARARSRHLTEALTGNFDAHHAQLARAILAALRPGRGRRWPSSNAVIAAACQPWAHQIELLQTIPGVGDKVAQVIIAETGGDMSRFPTAAHLAAWAGLAPAIYESAGKRTPAGARHGNKWLTACWSSRPARSGGCTARTTSPSSTPA